LFQCYYHSNNTTESITNLNNRTASQYVNTTYATSARNITCNDITPYNTNACDRGYPIITNDLIKTNTYYWLPMTFDSTTLREVNYSGTIAEAKDCSLGVRPVVTMKSGILKTGGSGTNSSAYNIAI